MSRASGFPNGGGEDQKEFDKCYLCFCMNTLSSSYREVPSQKDFQVAVDWRVVVLALGNGTSNPCFHVFAEDRRRGKMEHKQKVRRAMERLLNLPEETEMREPEQLVLQGQRGLILVPNLHADSRARGRRHGWQRPHRHGGTGRGEVGVQHQVVSERGSDVSSASESSLWGVNVNNWGHDFNLRIFDDPFRTQQQSANQGGRRYGTLGMRYLGLGAGDSASQASTMSSWVPIFDAGQHSVSYTVARLGPWDNENEYSDVWHEESDDLTHRW